MVAYFALQIVKGKLTYSQVVSKYPQYKDELDNILTEQGREDLIEDVVVLASTPAIMSLDQQEMYQKLYDAGVKDLEEIPREFRKNLKAR